MPGPLMRRCVEVFDADLLQLYGMTEAGGSLTALSPEAHRDSDHPERLVSVGTVLPNTEVRIVDPTTGAEAKTGEVGEIWSRTEQLMLGYWGDPSATADVLLDDGWFRTGDAGRFDDDGYLYLADRIKDMIISGGDNVYPAEIERVLVEHPAVGEVAVVGVPHPRWGESPKAVIVPAAVKVVDGDEILDFCRARLARFKCPTVVEVVTELPRTATGKVLKRALRHQVPAPREVDHADAH